MQNLDRPTIAADLARAQQQSGEQLLRYFAFDHLPELLQVTSAAFAQLATHLVDTTARSAERTVALRKLLESKDCAVRAALPGA